MKIDLKFLGEKWINKKLEVVDVYVKTITPTEALMILHNQELDPNHKDNYLTVIVDRTDLSYMPFSITQSAQVNFFTNKFKFYAIDNEYLLELLNN